MGLVYSISNFFTTKTSLANKWMRKKIPSCSNSALSPLFCCLALSESSETTWKSYKILIANIPKMVVEMVVVEILVEVVEGVSVEKEYMDINR